jgi:hypothetical protein
VLIKFPEHSVVLLLQRPQSIVNIATGSRSPKRLNLNENGSVPFSDFPIFAAMGHSADCRSASIKEGVI